MSRLNFTEVAPFHKALRAVCRLTARPTDDVAIANRRALKSRLPCLLAVTTLALFIWACDGDNGADDERDFSFSTGEFQVSTHGVDDRCLDGGLNLLFMPEGEDEPWAWPYSITLYDPEQLEQTYPLTLREPFGEMEVTASEASDLEQRLQIHPNDSVKLGEERFGDCVVELGGHGQVEMVDSDEVEGIIFLELSDPRGDERCPADMPEHCNVNVGFTGTRMDES